jgi:GTPase SAR1 family protein
LVFIIIEQNCGKFEIFHLLTTSSNNFETLPPCDIRDFNAHLNGENYALELWVPLCDDENEKLREMYYQGTDAFIIVFNASEPESLHFIATVILPQVRSFIDEQARVRNC